MTISPRLLQRYRNIQRVLDRLQVEAEPQASIVPGSPTPRGNIIVFPGSFNPPTLAHIALLKQARHFARQHGAMDIYAAMSKRTVDKEAVERPTLPDRIMLLMVLLRRRCPHTGILVFNCGLYVEQAQALRRSFPHVRRILFLMGFDKIVQILDPHYYSDRESALAELFHQAELLVAPRGSDGLPELMALVHQPHNEQYARYIHPLPFDVHYRDISSTAVRQGRIGFRDTVPQEVRHFMRQTRAYAPPLRQEDGTEIDYYAQRIKRINALLKYEQG